MEFPVGYVHLENRACPQLRKHSGCQTGRANSSHCSSRGIFNKRGKSPKSKYAQDSGVLPSNRKTSFAATVNCITCQWLLSSADTFSVAASWELHGQATKMNLCPKGAREPDSEASCQAVASWSLFCFLSQLSWMEIHIKIDTIFIKMLKFTLVYNCH